MNLELPEHLVDRAADDSSRSPKGSKGADASAVSVKLLMAIWGEGFIRQFAEIGLPTLLAPGNVPALAAEYPCEFVFLTSADDEETFLDHPAVRALKEICPVSFLPIDDLIVEGNYSTTVTLAYARAIQSCGEGMLNTYFIFLVSDYIMADGALRGLIKHIRDGRSGVLAGNFQVIHEDTGADLREAVDPDNHVLAIPPRQLMRYALEHLHPATVANMVNHEVSHSAHANRLFWRVDDDTLIGRFFLMHMLCIKPETTTFRIGSSCDYSFIPEMCPSGNVVVIEDSDEYLVVEHQGLGHEASFQQPGPFDGRVLAIDLSEWTTARHRENVRHTVVFHAADLPTALDGAMAQADAYVARLLRRMTPRPQPHRDHPYWRGAIAAFNLERRRIKRGSDWDLLTDADHYDGGTVLQALRRLYWALWGRAPVVRPWHHAWHDYRAVTDSLRRRLTDPAHRLLCVSESPNRFTDWLAGFGERVFPVQTTRMLRHPERYFADGQRRFDTCFIFLTEGELWRADKVLDAVAPALEDGIEINVFVPNQSHVLAMHNFPGQIAAHACKFCRPGFRLVGCSYSASRAQRLTRLVLEHCARLLAGNIIVNLPLVAAMLVPTYLVVTLDNLLRAARGNKTAGYCSSVTLTLVAERGTAPERPGPVGRTDRRAGAGATASVRAAQSYGDD